MSSSVPTWLDSLQPIQAPSLQPLSSHSSVKAWHVYVEFTPWRVPPGMSLTGSQTWNGKALVESSSPHLDASVGEVEVAERLRSAFPTRSSYWTAGSGHPPSQWRDWALMPTLRQREPWLLEMDQRIREADAALRGNQRGWPDVVSWGSGPEDLQCVEYKGPRPSNPNILDDVSIEQDAWFRAATRLPDLDIDRYAVVIWVPSREAKAILLEQSRAMVRRHAPGRAPHRMARGGDGGQPRPLVPHGDEQLHRRTIRKALMERMGARVVSHIDGTIDVQVPLSPDAFAFRDLVEREVTLLGYSPTLEVVSSRSGSATIRVSTPETLAQQGRGAHGTP